MKMDDNPYQSPLEDNELAMSEYHPLWVVILFLPAFFADLFKTPGTPWAFASVLILEICWCCFLLVAFITTTITAIEWVLQ